MKLLRIIVLSIGIAIAHRSINAAQLIGIYNTLPAGSFKVIANNITVKEAKPFPTDLDLPITVNITHQGKVSKLTIKEDYRNSTACDATTIIAEVDGYPASKKTLCISKALNTEFDPLPIHFFQGIVLALAKKDKPEVGDLPFDFGISGWSTTKGAWQRKIIAAPADDESSLFVTNSKPKPLTILQGYNAWGGGTIPPLDHATIAHIYNNTPYTLIMTR